MIIKNNLKRDFSITPNAIILDQSISAEALRVYLYIGTKPETWIVRHSDIQAMLNINSRRSMAKYARELIDAGWVTRALRHGENGSFNGGYDYELHSSKQPVKIATDVSKNERTDVSKNERTDVSKNERTDVSKNERTDVSKNERTDVSKNERGGCAKNALSQNMNTSNTEIDRVIDNKVSNTYLNVWEIWKSIIALTSHNFSIPEIDAIRNWAEFKRIAEPAQINATLRNLKRFKLNNANICNAIDQSIAGNYNGIIDLSPKAYNGKPIAANPLHRCNDQDFAEAF